MEKKLTNSGPLRESADKHSIYTMDIDAAFGLDHCVGHPLSFSHVCPHPKTLPSLLDLDAGFQVIWNTGWSGAISLRSSSEAWSSTPKNCPVSRFHRRRYARSTGVCMRSRSLAPGCARAVARPAALLHLPHAGCAPIACPRVAPP